MPEAISGPALYVDADACPVKAEAERVAARLGWRVFMVSNGGLRPSGLPGVEMVFVPEGPDAADDWIAARVGAGDVVVTADIPLAARCIASGAQVLRPDGEALGPRNIGEILATRDLMAGLRGADPYMRGGGRPYSRADRSRFLERLDVMLRRPVPGPGPGAGRPE